MIDWCKGSRACLLPDTSEPVQKWGTGLFAAVFRERSIDPRLVLDVAVISKGEGTTALSAPHADA
jgi:hypothetical protein